jgi:hypothetical protein
LTEGKIFRTYYVWPRFPSVSISGSACALSCLHCNKEYLKFMAPATTPAALVHFAESLVENKSGEGLLVSGGCDADGRMLNLPRFLPALAKLHKMGIIVKLHTGLVDEKLARDIVEAGIRRLAPIGERDFRARRRTGGLRRDVRTSARRWRSAHSPSRRSRIARGGTAGRVERH